DSWEEYANAKMNITKNQLESDYVIVNADQKEVMELISFTKAKIIPFSTKKFIQDGASIRNGMLTFMGEDIISLEKIVLPGAHNLENILSATAAVKLMGVDNEAIRKVLTSFTGVKHRTQFVEEINGRKFYNDSKATNILAASSALNAFD